MYRSFPVGPGYVLTNDGVQITFNWEKNYWEYDMSAIEPSLHGNKMIADPTDLTFLRDHFRELPEDAKKFLLWASFFGPTFKVAEVALLMDWEDSSGSSGSDEEAEDMWNVSKAVSRVSSISDRDGSSSGRGSMRGLQVAIAEGWLVQRARDMCSFSHDRYRQATQAEAELLPEETVSKMSFRVCMLASHIAKLNLMTVTSIDNTDDAARIDSRRLPHR